MAGWQGVLDPLGDSLRRACCAVREGKGTLLRKFIWHGKRWVLLLGREDVLFLDEQKKES
jgi:hypothetical protein